MLADQSWLINVGCSIMVGTRRLVESPLIRKARMLSQPIPANPGR
jgi:hypothetical protein